MDPATRLDCEAARRHGVITKRRARELGLTDRQIRQRVANGRWRATSPGVLVVTGAPRTPRQTLLVASLRHGGAASHASAAWLHGLLDEPPSRPHIIRSSTAGTRDRSSVVHSSVDLYRRDLVTVDSIRTTTATRTLLDMGSCTDAGELRRLVDRARHRRLTHPDALVARFVSFARPGRRGTAVLREVLSELDDDVGLLESDLETMLLELVVSAGLPVPKPQHTVHITGRTYRLDFAYPDQMVAIEGDGFEFHSQRDRFESDRSRQNDLTLSGWLVLRFTWRQIVRDPEWVVSQIAEALHSRSDAHARR